MKKRRRPESVIATKIIKRRAVFEYISNGDKFCQDSRKSKKPERFCADKRKHLAHAVYAVNAAHNRCFKRFVYIIHVFS